MGSSFKRFYGPVLVLFGVLISVAVYWPGLYGGFFFDDGPNILHNPEVRLDNIAGDSLKTALFSGLAGYFGRPVSQLSFSLNYYFSGFDPFVFKLTNLGIHCLNGILVYLLAWQVLDSLKQRVGLRNVGLCAALVAVMWTVHPIQLSSVLYVVQRMTSLSALFLLIALLLHIRARRSGEIDRLSILCLILAWFVFWPLSVLSKESGVLFSGYVLAYELIIRRSERGSLDLFGRTTLYLSIAFSIGLVLYLALPQGQWLVSGYEHRSFSLTERLLTESRAIWEYLGLIVFPRLDAFALFHDDFVVSTSLVSPKSTLAAMAGLLSLGVIAVTVRRTWPLVSFGIAWFLIGHSLESTFIPLELVHEHRNYLPLFGICLLPVALLSSMSLGSRMKRVTAITVLGAVVAYFAFITALRADMFSNDAIRTQLEAEFHPNSPRANYEVGRTFAYLSETDPGNQIAFSFAKKSYERASELDRDYKMGLFGIVVLGCGASQIVDQPAFDELRRRFNEQLILSEDTSILMAIVEMSREGHICLTRSNIDNLFESFQANKKVDLDTKRNMHALHADYLWLNAKDMAGARSALSKALELSPHDASLRLKWAQLDFIAGENDQARRLLLELRDEKLSPEEHKTINQVLASIEGDKNNHLQTLP